MPDARPGQEHAAESAANRLALRNAMRRDKIALRLALPAALHAQRSAQLADHLAALLERCAAAIIAFCWPIQAEFDCRPQVKACMERGARACLPVVTEPGSAMEFREWVPGCALSVDRFGIHYPAQGETLRPDLLLMPVNAFDANGFRLGYGGGYFDRTLAAMAPRPVTIGLGFELARVATTLPGEYDIGLDAVVTEAGSQAFSARVGT